MDNVTLRIHIKTLMRTMCPDPEQRKAATLLADVLFSLNEANQAKKEKTT